MADQVAQGMRDRKLLRFGTLVDPTIPFDAQENNRRPSAIFVGDDKDDWKESDDKMSKYVFTSFRWVQLFVDNKR